MCELIAPDEWFEIEPYAENAEAAKEKSVLAQLRRLYPDVDVQYSELSPFILDRTLHYMLHLDQTFELNRTWDNAHYQTMTEQAEAYKEWLDSPDGTPVPTILKYNPIVLVTETDDDNSEPNTEILTDTVEKTKTPRTKNSGSRYQRAMAIHAEDVANGRTRASTLERFDKELGLAKATANVYYSIFKGLRK
mgnify:FL=1